jgi:hypothetical protein
MTIPAKTPRRCKPYRVIPRLTIKMGIPAIAAGKKAVHKATVLAITAVPPIMIAAVMKGPVPSFIWIIEMFFQKFGNFRWFFLFQPLKRERVRF